MSRLNKIAVLLMVAFVIFNLTGCGGGGGSSTTGTTVSNAELVNVTGFINIPGTDKSGVVVTMMEKDGDTVTAINKMIQGKIDADPAVLNSPDRSLGIYMAVTDATGFFRVYNVPVGEYVLSAKKGDVFVSAQKNLSVSREVINETTNEQVLDDVIQLTPTGSISGSVSFSPVSTNMSGVLCYIPGTSYMAVTDISGNFVISQVPANTAHTVYFEKSGYSSNSAGPVTIASAGGTATVSPVVLSLIVELPVANGITLSTSSPIINTNPLLLTITNTTTPAPVNMSFKIENIANFSNMTVNASPSKINRNINTNVETFDGSRSITLPFDGKFRITGYFYYANGERKEALLSNNVVLDRTGPVFEEIDINEDTQPFILKKTANSVCRRYINFSIDAYDPTGITEMYVGNVAFNSTIHTMVPYDRDYYESNDYDLLPGAGLKNIYLAFKDGANNISTFTWDTNYRPYIALEFTNDKIYLDSRDVINARSNERVVGDLMAVYFGNAIEMGIIPDSVETVPVSGRIDSGFNYTPPVSGNDVVKFIHTIDGITHEKTVEVMFNTEKSVVGINYNNGTQIYIQELDDYDLSKHVTIAKFDDGSFRIIPPSELSYTVILNISGTDVSTPVADPYIFNPDLPSLSSAFGSVVVEYTDPSGVTHTNSTPLEVYVISSVVPDQSEFEVYANGPAYRYSGIAHIIFSNSMFNKSVLLGVPTVTAGRGSVSGVYFTPPSTPTVAGTDSMVFTYISDVGQSFTRPVNYIVKPSVTVSAPVISNLVQFPATDNTVMTPAGWVTISFDTDIPCKTAILFDNETHADLVTYEVTDLNYKYRKNGPDVYSTSHTITLSDLSDGEKYYYTIAAVAADGGSSNYQYEEFFVNYYADTTLSTISLSPGTSPVYDNTLSDSNYHPFYSFQILNDAASPNPVNFQKVRIALNGLNSTINVDDLLSYRLYESSDLSTPVQSSVKVNTSLGTVEFTIDRVIKPGESLDLVMMAIVNPDSKPFITVGSDTIQFTIGASTALDVYMTTNNEPLGVTEVSFSTNPLNSAIVNFN